ncbi:S-layer protein, partial [Candidatus Woesearchaeota archaeon]|nr:S-layer protein [Candidatus Woesearchaeota archaeon]
FSVPGDNVNYDVEVVVGGTTSALAVTGGSLEQADLSSLRAVTFDDVVDKTSGHLILVGGPAVNSLTAEALGLEFPTSGVASTIPENKAILKWIDGAFGGSNTVLIVAGWEAAETQAAASVLQAYSTYSSDLDGKTSVEVVGTTVTAVGADTSAE